MVLVASYYICFYHLIYIGNLDASDSTATPEIVAIIVVAVIIVIIIIIIVRKIIIIIVCKRMKKTTTNIRENVSPYYDALLTYGRRQKITICNHFSG